jgi:transposase
MSRSPAISASRRSEVVDLYKSGKTMAEVGAAFGVSAPTIWLLFKLMGINSKGIRQKAGPGKPGKYKRTVPMEKYVALAEQYKSGKTLAAIGLEYGVSRERVRQILKSLGLGRMDGGRTIRMLKSTPERVDALRAKDERKERRIRATWDMSLSDYKAHVEEHGSCSDESSPMHKYMHHRKNAARRGIAWNFTFASWWRVWRESGKWDQRGRGLYVMARYGDGGTPYSPETVYICTQSQNSKDSFLVWPDRQPGYRPATNEQVARVAMMREQRTPQPGRGKLTEQEVRSIRLDNRPGVVIAAAYGITGATVSQIRNRKIWQHVD